ASYHSGMVPLPEITQRLAALAGEYDRSGVWPDHSMRVITEAGALRWIIPKRFGGDGWSPLQLLEGYEGIGRGCLATLLILTQRDAACDLIDGSPNEALKSELLPRFARGEALTTVGISQITTSHQAGPPAMTATLHGGGYRLNGFMPWATAAAK